MRCCLFARDILYSRVTLKMARPHAQAGDDARGSPCKAPLTPNSAKILETELALTVLARQVYCGGK